MFNEFRLVLGHCWLERVSIL